MRSSEEPGPTKGIRTKKRIAEAALRIFARDGYVKTRMSDVAAEADLSMGGLYRYFGNKTELFEYLVSNLYDEFFEVSRPRGTSFESSPEDAVMESNLRYFEKYAENRDLMRAFIESANVDEQFLELWWAGRRRHVDRFVHVLSTRPEWADQPEELLRMRAEAVACMAEETAYVWFAQGSRSKTTVTPEAAAAVVTLAAGPLLLNPEALPTATGSAT